MTKKELIESLKNIPDDAVILAVQQRNGICYRAYWGSDNEYKFVVDIMQGAKYVPLTNRFKLSDYK